MRPIAPGERLRLWQGQEGAGRTVVVRVRVPRGSETRGSHLLEPAGFTRLATATDGPFHTWVTARKLAPRSCQALVPPGTDPAYLRKQWRRWVYGAAYDTRTWHIVQLTNRHPTPACSRP